MKAFFKSLVCKHGPWRILDIAWDGETTVECRQCGKIKHQPLKYQPVTPEEDEAWAELEKRQ